MTDDQPDITDAPDGEEAPDDDHAQPDATPETRTAPARRNRNLDWPRLIAFVVLPAVAVLLGAGAGVLKWQSASMRDSQTAATQSVAAAREAATAILSYQAGSVEKDLNAARDRLTGSFLGAYTDLINDVVIPGAKEKGISTAAEVPAAASVSATSSHAVALLFVNQTVTIGKDAPTTSASTVRVTLDKVGDRWLVSGFDPV